MNKLSRLATIAALAATVHMAALPVVANAQGSASPGLTQSQVDQAIKNLNAKLNELGIQGQITGATQDGANTVFQLQPNAGVTAETLQQQLVAAQNALSANTVAGTAQNAIVVSNSAAASWASGFGVAIAGAAGVSLLPAVLAAALLGVAIAGIDGDASAPAPPPPAYP